MPATLSPTTNPAGPTVLVKKADGTTVRVPLSELKKMRSQTIAPTLSTDDKPAVEETGKEKWEMRNEKRETFFMSSGRMMGNEKVESRSQKPERASPTSNFQHQTSASELDAALARLDEYLRKKEKEKGKMEIGKMEIENEKREMGGTKAVNLKSKIANLKSPWAVEDHKSLLDDDFHTENLPMVIDARRQALERVRPIAKPRETARETMRNAGNTEMRNEKREMGNGLGAKALSNVLHDVLPAVAEMRPVGPVDELRQMTILEFRRLAPTAGAAASKLQHKFETVKGESYLLYLSAIPAWRESPLYADFLNILAGAIRERKTIRDYAATAKSLSVEEVMEIAEMGRELT